MQVIIDIDQNHINLLEKCNEDAIEKSWQNVADIVAVALSNYNKQDALKKTAFAMSKQTGLVFMTAALIGIRVMAAMNDVLDAQDAEEKKPDDGEQEEPDKQNGS